MPGVLIVETLAQAGSIPLLKLFFKGKTACPGGLNNVKFRSNSGDVLTLKWIS